MKVRAGWQKHGSWYWVRPGFRPTAINKAENREIFYNQIVIRLMKTMLRFQGIQMSVAGSENLPDTGGALLALNHTGYFDFIFGGTAANLHGRRLVRFMAKKEVFDVPVVGALMRKMKHIPVDRSAGAGTSALDAAVTSLRAGNLVGIFPEATISRSFEIKDIKTGAARIAKEAGVPLALTGVVEDDTAKLRETMKIMLDRLRSEYETEYGPFPGGEYWRPAALGGGAPALE